MDGPPTLWACVAPRLPRAHSPWMLGYRIAWAWMGVAGSPFSGFLLCASLLYKKFMPLCHGFIFYSKCSNQAHMRLQAPEMRQWGTFLQQWVTLGPPSNHIDLNKMFRQCLPPATFCNALAIVNSGHYINILHMSDAKGL